MSNQAYAQSESLLPSVWVGGTIQALLCTGGVFDADHTLVSETGAVVTQTQPVNGRGIRETDVLEFYSGPVAFFMVQPDTEWLILLVQDLGTGDPALLGWVDERSSGSPISIERQGTLILRPSLSNEDPELPDRIGVWFTGEPAT